MHVYMYIYTLLYVYIYIYHHSYIYTHISFQIHIYLHMKGRNDACMCNTHTQPTIYVYTYLTKHQHWQHGSFVHQQHNNTHRTLAPILLPVRSRLYVGGICTTDFPATSGCLCAHNCLPISRCRAQVSSDATTCCPHLLSNAEIHMNT